MSYTAASVEVLVIGGGVIGSSIAFHVARQGRSVLVVERNEIGVEPAASWASAGGIRLWEQDPAEAALARIAIERWPTLAEELDADLQYRQSGHLMLAENKTEAEHLQTFVQGQRELGFADLSFLERKAVFGLVPELPTPELDQLSPDRIARFDLAQVAAFMTEQAISNVVE